MMNAIESNDSKFEQSLNTILQTATLSTELVDALTVVYESQKNDHFKWLLNNHMRNHSSSTSQVALIEGAITLLN